ncbi:VacJ family lipoprotein [methanotrophic bacterial endosymbiont of Bathymodiolus sp.]|jgi:phospholipid-binding lipoprotein MlaA|nr:VacJ family lipoprotein [methanotrophic bacterial endosymbiont of Bathymodiolus sp.]
MINKISKYRLVLGLILLAMLQACATVSHPDPADPWEGMNRDILSFNDQVDKFVLKPVAKGYQWITPEFVDTGISNFFSNLKDIGVSVNGFLQAKPKQCGMDTARFLVNSTAGIGGFIDVATMIDLPKHEEDFAQTLAVWGVPRGPYFVIPLLGPSSVRGVGGYIGDTALHPLTYTLFFGSTALSTGLSVGLRTVEIIDVRADFLGAEAVASEAAVDRYIFFRSAYMQRRDYLISDGAAQPLDVEGMDGEDLGEDLYLELE